MSVTPFPRPAEEAQVDLRDPVYYINRELSWLEFNQRVLDQATSDYHPLLERVKFLAIVASDLDEFFMVRVAPLLKKQRAGAEDLSPDGLTPSEQLAAVRQRAARLMEDQATCWRTSLRPALEQHGIRFLDPDHYTDSVRGYLTKYFRREIFPLLTPLAFDPGHPFPFISNRSRNFAIVVRQRAAGAARVVHLEAARARTPARNGVVQALEAVSERMTGTTSTSLCGPPLTRRRLANARAPAAPGM